MTLLVIGLGVLAAWIVFLFLVWRHPMPPQRELSPYARSVMRFGAHMKQLERALGESLPATKRMTDAMMAFQHAWTRSR